MSSVPSTFPPHTHTLTGSRWTLEQAFLSSDWYVKDERGNQVFRAESKFLSLRWDFDFIDSGTGQTIGKIQQTPMILGMPKFTIFLGDNIECGVLEQRFTWFAKEFRIVRKQRFFNSNNGKNEKKEKEENGEEIVVSGDWTNHSFVFKRATDGRTIASVEKPFFSLRNNYTVHIEPGEDALFILACSIAIDKCITISRRRRRR